MERCISDICTWMLTDKLKLNDDKTEFMLIGTKQQLFKVNIDCLTVGSIDVAPFTVARNLGTWFDSNLNLQEQVHKTCKSGFFHLYNIRRIRKYLSQESARTKDLKIGILNSSSTDKDLNLAPGIWNPRSGIQNLRLSSIPSHYIKRY